MASTILLIEDEPAIADTVLYALRTDGFIPVWARTCGEAESLVNSTPPDLIVLDIGLPDGNGFDWCRCYRQSKHTPIIFLTARSDEVDRIVGLEIGADDYVTKPFSPRELVARIKAVLRRVNGTMNSHELCETINQTSNPSSSLCSSIHGFTHDELRCRIAYLGTWLELTRYEYRLLRTLLGHPGRIYSRDQLMNHAWEDPGSSTDRAVDTQIKTLRAKLRLVDAARDPVQTHRGFGYSLREENT